MRSEGRSTSGRDIVVTIAAATVALGALLVASGVIPTPDVGTFLADATSSIGGWMYVVVAALAFLETAAFVGLLVPGGWRSSWAEWRLRTGRSSWSR
jgi:hypothetical protein